METENQQVRNRSRRSRKKQSDADRPIRYTQPKPFFRKKLAVQLLTVAAVALAVAIGTSIFFKVDTIYVTGASRYSPLTVQEASGIEKGDSLLFFGRAKAAARIKSELLYVDTVRFELALPGTVNIVIEEKTVVYALEATDGTFWKMTADGTIVEPMALSETSVPRITGVLLDDPAAGKTAVAWEDSQSQSVTTNAERLAAARQILTCMATWELLDDVTELNVADLYALRLDCGEEYRIELGDLQDMEQKIGLVKALLSGEEKPDPGVLELFYADEQWQILAYPWQ